MGGWAAFNGFFAENAALVEESCAPYKTESNKNECAKYSGCREIARVSRTYKLNPSNEEAIQKEILYNGMMYLSLVTPPGYHAFTTGVLREEMDTNGVAPTHAVNCIGWGVENGVKYWIIRNSYSEQFGDKGDIKILRGQNLYQIEQHGSGFEPELLI